MSASPRRLERGASFSEEVPSSRSCNWKKNIVISLIFAGAMGTLLGVAFIFKAKGILQLKFLPNLDLRLTIIVTGAVGGGTLVLGTVYYYSRIGKRNNEIERSDETEGPELEQPGPPLTPKQQADLEKWRQRLEAEWEAQRSQRLLQQVEKEKNQELLNKASKLPYTFYTYYLYKANTELHTKLKTFLDTHSEEELQKIGKIYEKSFNTIFEGGDLSKLHGYPAVMELFLLSDEEFGKVSVESIKTLMDSTNDEKIKIIIKLRLIAYFERAPQATERGDVLSIREIRLLDASEIEEKLSPELYFLIREDQKLKLVEKSSDLKATLALLFPNHGEDEYRVSSIKLLDSWNTGSLEAYTVKEINSILPGLEVYHLQCLSQQCITSSLFDMKCLLEISDEKEKKAKIQALFKASSSDPQRHSSLTTLGTQNFELLSSLIPFLTADLIKKLPSRFFVNNRLGLERLDDAYDATLNKIFHCTKYTLEATQEIVQAMNQSLVPLLPRLDGKSLATLAMTTTVDFDPSKLTPNQIYQLFRELETWERDNKDNPNLRRTTLDHWGVEKTNSILKDLPCLSQLSDEMLQNPGLMLTKVSRQQINSMFAYDKYRKEAFENSKRRIQLIPPTKINEIVHLLDGRTLALLSPQQLQAVNLLEDGTNHCRLSEKQANDLFETCTNNAKDFSINDRSSEVFKALGVVNTNLLLPSLYFNHLAKLPKELLGNEGLKIERVQSERLNHAFYYECTSYDHNKRQYADDKARFQSIHPSTIQKILPLLDGKTLALLTDVQLKAISLASAEDATKCVLSQTQIEQLCKVLSEMHELGEYGRERQFLETLSLDNVNLLLPSLTVPILKHLPEKHLSNPDLKLETVPSNRLVYVFEYSCSNYSHYKTQYEDAKKRFQWIHSSTLNRLLPLLNGTLLALMSQDQVRQLVIDETSFSREKIQEMFKKCQEQMQAFSVPDRSVELFEAMSIEQVNRILPLLTSIDIKSLPEVHLKNPKLALDTVDPKVLSAAFEYPNDRYRKEQYLVAKRRWQCIDPSVIQKILPCLTGPLLSILSGDQLQRLNLQQPTSGCILSKDQVNNLFEACRNQEDTFETKDISKGVWTALSIGNINAMLPLLYLHRAQTLPHEVLNNPGLRLESLDATVLKKMFSYSRDTIYSFDGILSRVRGMSIEIINAKIEHLPGEAIAFLSPEQFQKLDASKLTHAQIRALCDQISSLHYLSETRRNQAFNGSAQSYFYENFGHHNFDAVIANGTFSSFYWKDLLPQSYLNAPHQSLHLLSEKDLDEVFPLWGEHASGNTKVRIFEESQKRMQGITSPENIQMLFPKLSNSRLALMSGSQLSHVDFRKALDPSTSKQKIQEWFSILSDMQYLSEKQKITEAFRGISPSQLGILLPQVPNYSLKFLPPDKLEVEALETLKKEDLKQVFYYESNSKDSIQSARVKFQSMKPEVINALLKQDLLDADTLIFLSNEQLQKLEYTLILPYFWLIFSKLQSISDSKRLQEMFSVLGFETINPHLNRLSPKVFRQLPLDFFKNPAFNLNSLGNHQITVLFEYENRQHSDTDKGTKERLTALAQFNRASLMAQRDRIERIHPNLKPFLATLLN